MNQNNPASNLLFCIVMRRTAAKTILILCDYYSLALFQNWDKWKLLELLFLEISELKVQNWIPSGPCELFPTNVCVDIFLVKHFSICTLGKMPFTLSHFEINFHAIFLRSCFIQSQSCRLRRVASKRANRKYTHIRYLILSPD